MNNHEDPIAADDLEFLLSLDSEPTPGPEKEYEYSAYELAEQEHWRTVTSLVLHYKSQVEGAQAELDAYLAGNEEDVHRHQYLDCHVGELQQILAPLKEAQILLRKHCVC